MLYVLTSDNGPVRVVEAPAHRRGEVPRALLRWVVEVWMPSSGAASVEVVHYSPMQIGADGVRRPGVATVLCEVRSTGEVTRDVA